jgi:Fe-S cluster assembly iron-binding protein IscA
LAWALDELKENDLSVVLGGLTYLIEKELSEKIGGVKIDFLDQGMRSGFMVSSENPVSTGPLACGSTCSC